MLKRFNLKSGCKLLLIISCVISGAICAHADFKPEDALSSCPDNSVYAVLSLEDAGGLLRWAFSDINLRLLAPVLDFKDEDIEMISSIVSQIPCKALTALIGTDARGKPFFKAAAAFSDDCRPILDLISRGEATPDDLKKLIFGADSPLGAIAESIIKVDRLKPEKNFSGILRVNNTTLIGAHENLLVAASTPEAIKLGIAALSDENSRLNLNRRMNSKNFMFIHADMQTVVKQINRRRRTRKMIRPSHLRLLNKMFVSPLNIEADFELMPECFKIYGFINLDVALSDNAYSELAVNTPVNGGYMDLDIAETPIFAFGTKLNVNLLKKLADISRRFSGFIDALEKNGVSSELFFDLMDGPLTVNLGGNFINMGLFKLPAFYLAKTGQNGAANDFMAKVPREKGAVVKSEGWQALLKAPVTVSPVPLYIGNYDETLFFGVFEPALINKIKVKAQELTQNFKSEFKNLIAEKSLMSFYLDFEMLQDYLKREFRGALKFIAVLAGAQNEIMKLRNLLDARLSLTSISFYEPNYGEYVTEVSLKDVSPDEGLWSKIISVIIQ